MVDRAATEQTSRESIVPGGHGADRRQRQCAHHLSLATLVPNLSDELKLAVVQGAVVGGGLTVIANAPNPAGQALLGRFLDGAILPIGLLAGALLPTVITAIVFRLL